MSAQARCPSEEEKPWQGKREVELIEPYLYGSVAPEVLDLFADAVAGLVAP